MNKRKIFNFVRVFVSIALLSFLIYRNRGNFKSILDTLGDLDIKFLIIAAFLYFIAISFIVFRWGTLLQAHGYNISKPFLWQSAYIGWFYNMLLPTGVGGDFYRGYDLHENKGVPMEENISAIVLERIIGTFTGITLLIAAFFLGTFSYLSKNAVISLLSILGVTLAFFVVLFFPRVFKIDVMIRKIRFFDRIRPRLKSFHDILLSYRNKKKFVFISYCYSIFIQMVFVTSYYFIGLSIGISTNYSMMVFTSPFASVVTSIPIALGGIGLRENATVYVLESFGVSRGDATLFSFIILSLILFNALLGGLVYVIKNIFYKSKGII